MIYNYNYVGLKIIKGQSFVNYIVLEILCRSKKKGMPRYFNEKMVINKYKDLVQNVNPIYIKKPINKAYQICKTLKPQQLKIIKRALHKNLDVIGICEGRTVPVLYAEIKKVNKGLANQLYIFCKSLYTEVLKLKPFKDLFGELKNHYNEFSKENGFKSKRCPFCGSTRMENEYNTKKDAYDHFLPKEQYPFISIHFFNLAPMCYKCNSLYKSRKNPIDINKSGEFKKVFYPFSIYNKIDFKIELHNIQLDKITPSEIDIVNSLAGFDEEVKSWENIFSIRSRHRSIYAGDGFNWLEEVRICTDNFGETYKDHKENLGKNFFCNENFMKLSLLEACERKNII